MRFLGRIYSIFLVIVLSVLFIMVLFLVNTLQMMDDDGNLNYIPENSVFVAKINTASLLKLTANELISSKDKDILDQIEDMDFSSGKSPFNGINFASNIYFLIIPFEDKFVEGFLFNISDKKSYDEYYSKEEKYASYSDDHVGILLFKDLGNSSEIESKKLKSLAQQIIDSPQNRELKIDFSNEGSVVSTWTSGASNNLPFSNNLELCFDQHSISLNGTLSVSETTGNEYNYLSRKGVSFATALIPKEINDSLTGFLHKIGLTESVKINSFSANYSGINFDQSESLTIAPQLEILLNSDSEIDWNKIADQLESKNYLQRSDSIRFVFNEVIFNAVQPEKDQLLIYTGTLPSNSEIRNELFEFSGDPSLLFKVGGNSPYGQFLNFIPLFRSGRVLTNATEKTEIKVTPIKNGQFKVKGIIQFKPDYSPIIELIRFLNSSALLK